MTTPAVVDIQLKDISLSGGVNESFRQEALDWTKYFTKAENLVIDQYGSLVKRPGRGLMMNALPQDDAGGDLVKLMKAYQFPGGMAVSCTDTLIGASHSLYNYNESKDSLTKIGKLPEFSSVPVQVPGSQLSITSISTTSPVSVQCSGAIEVGNYLVVAVCNVNAPAIMYVMDKTSKSLVRSYSFGTTSSNTALCICKVGTDVHVYENSATAQNFYRYQTSNLTLSASTALASSSAGRAIVGCVPLPSGAGSVVLNGMDGADSRLQKFDSSGTSVATVTIASATMTGISVDSSGNIYTAGYIIASGRVTVSKHNSSLVLQSTVTDAATAPTTYGIIRIAVDDTGAAGRLVCWRQAAGTIKPDIWVTVPGTTAVTTLIGTLTNWKEASQPFYSVRAAKYYMAVTKYTSGETTGNSVVIDITSGSLAGGASNETRFRPVAVVGGYNDLTIMQGTPGGGSSIGALYTVGGSGGGMAPQIYAPTEGDGEYWIVPTTYKASATSVGHVANYMYLFDARYLANAGDEISGGCVYHHDGGVPAELGWVDRPYVNAALGAAGGPAVGARNYVAVYEYVGPDGNVHYSRCSPVNNFTNTGGVKIDLTVTLPTVTARGDGSRVRCLVYRTVTNGTSYYLLTILEASSGGFSTYPTYYATYSDNTSDSSLSSRPIMFRQPGVSGAALDRYAPPQSVAICSHKDRIMSASGSVVYYSSFKVDAEAPWFNPAFSIYVPGGSGDITGMASMDGQLFIFKRDGIWVVDGDGPPENGGTGTEFSPPRRLRTEFGCIDQRTVVVTPIGVMYRSGRGIELLEPNGQVQWIGEAVMSTVDDFPYSGTACVDRSGGRVMFPLGDTQGTYPGLLTYSGTGDQNGITVVYDLAAGCWTTAKYRGSSGDPGAYVQDYVYSSFGGHPRLISLGAGGLCQHDPDNYLDNAGTEYSNFTLITGWIKADSMQDRIRLTDLLVLCKKVTNHNLSVAVSYDYNETEQYVKTWTPADINSLTIEQLELQAPKQLVQAMRFRISDSAPSDTVTYPITTGKGPDIIGLTVKYGIKGGGAKLPSGSKG